MLVALVVVIIGDHLIRLTLEAHTLIATTAGHSVAPINPVYWDFASLVGTLPDAICQHVFFEDLVAACLCVLAGHTWMVAELSRKGVTLHCKQ